MARVLALISDLLFGSRVQADLSAGGHQIELVDAPEQVRERLARADVLVVDLTDERLGGAELVEGLHPAAHADDVAESSASAGPCPRTLGFYSHIDTATRERGERAGFDMVVPRSRMAREGSALVARLAAESPRRTGSGRGSAGS